MGPGLKFPVLKGKKVFPQKAVCPWCRERKVFEPNAFAVLMGGAMRVTDEKRKSATVASDCVGFLNMNWHGAHDGGQDVGEHGAGDVGVSIADWTPGGQWEMYFCSTWCLRQFLNDCVDELEMRRALSRAKSKKRRGKK